MNTKQAVKITLLLSFCLFAYSLLFVGQVSAISIAPGGSAGNIEELNTALGGMHQIQNNEIILEDDIELSDTVSIKGFTEDLTVNANGKMIRASGNIKSIFTANNVNLKITGNGIFVTSARYANCIKFIGPGTFTVDSGTFDEGADKVAIRVAGAGTKTIINGGIFDGGIAVHNGTELSGDTDLEFDLLIDPCIVEINGGKISGISLWAPCKYIDDIETIGEYGYNTLTVNGGNSNITELRCNRTRTEINDGKISHAEVSDSSVVRMNGGTFTGEGLDILNGSKLIMNGGTFSSFYKDDGECILLRDSVLGKKSNWTSVINGGKINQLLSYFGRLKGYKGERCGIRVLGKSSLKICNINMYGGVYGSNDTRYGTGILLKGEKKYRPALYIAGLKGKTIKMVNYRNAIEANSKYANVYLKAHTFVKAPKNKKKKYYKKGRITEKKIVGNIKAGYR